MPAMDLQRRETPSPMSPGAHKVRQHRLKLSCDECRRRKIKCVKEEPQRCGSCRNCTRTAKACVFSPSKKPRLSGGGTSLRRRQVRRSVEERGCGSIDGAIQTAESVGFDVVALPQSPSSYHSNTGSGSLTTPEEFSSERGYGLDDEELKIEHASDVECVVRRRSLGGSTSSPGHEPADAALVSISSLLPGPVMEPGRPNTTVLSIPNQIHMAHRPAPQRETRPRRPPLDLRSYTEFVGNEADRIETSSTTTVYSSNNDDSLGRSLLIKPTCNHNARALLSVIDGQCHCGPTSTAAPPLAGAFAKIDLVVQCAEEMVQCRFCCVADSEVLSSLVLVVYRVSEWYQLAAASSIGPALIQCAPESAVVEEDDDAWEPPFSGAPSDSVERHRGTCTGQMALSSAYHAVGHELRPESDLVVKWMLPRVTRIRRLAQVLQECGMAEL